MMSSAEMPELPYVDFIFQQLEAGNAEVQQAWGRHMHWGYWADPEKADISVSGYEAAADALSLQHFRDVTLKPGMRIADIGCGLGGTVGLLNEAYEELVIQGLNIDPRQVDYARKNVRPRASSDNQIEFLVGDACELPFEDESLDLVVSVECIFHFSSRKRYFEEVRRVLRPGGHLVVSDFVAKAWSIPLVVLLYLPFQKGVRKSYGDAGMPPTRSLYERLGRSSALELVSINDVTENTLPNYRALPPLVRGTPAEADFNAGLRFLELVTRAGFYTYDLFTYRRK